MELLFLLIVFISYKFMEETSSVFILLVYAREEETRSNSNQCGVVDKVLDQLLGVLSSGSCPAMENN